MADLGSVGLPLVLFQGVLGGWVGSVAGCVQEVLPAGRLELSGIQEKPAREDTAGPAYTYHEKFPRAFDVSPVFDLCNASPSRIQ